LNEGEILKQVGPEITPSFTIPDKSYEKSYTGAVKSMAQLMWDFGKAINTNYQQEYSSADLKDAYNQIAAFDVELTPFHETYDYDEFVQTILDVDMIVAMFEDECTGVQYCGIVEGGEIIHSGDPMDSDSADIFLYRVDRKYGADKGHDDYMMIYRDRPEENEFKCLKYFDMNAR